tara:strand:+ start:659 stop:1132 length:474 start_codon:yes stop_codon:yes gene_type:complete
MSTDNIHPQVRAIVALLCEGYNVPSSETKIKAFADKLQYPHVPALKETYEMFTDGRANSIKMPTIAEFMQVYKEVKRRHENVKTQIFIEHKNNTIDYSKSKIMFGKLIKLVKEGDYRSKGICDMDVTGWEDGLKFTLSRDKDGKDYVYYHNHPINDK